MLTGLAGIPLYGEQPALSLYDSKIKSWCYDYNTVLITWKVPVVPALDENNLPLPRPTHWRLIKSFSGAPDNTFDADLVVGGLYGDPANPDANFLTSYVDNTEYEEGTEVTYSLWIFDTKDWRYCGSTTVFIVPNDGSLTKVFKWIPHSWLNTVNGVGDITGEAGSDDLS
jgi:hypothetical protein